MKLSLGQLKGRMARRDPRNLLPGYGQVAENIWFGRDDVRPLEQPSFVYQLSKLGTRTIYRFGLATISETEFWFHWTTDVDVVKGQVPNDTNERTFWTGDGAPKFTTAALGTAGTNLPSAARFLALPGPTVAPTATAVAGTGSGSAEQRTYVYTFVNEFGDESVPSPLRNITVLVNQHVTLSALQTATSNAVPIVQKRVYRATAGQLLFVAEIPASSATFLDNYAADNVGPGTLPSTTWDPPPANLRGLVSLPNGTLAALSGDDLRFCEPERPYAWPTDYTYPSGFPPVGLGVFGQSVVVLTNGRHKIYSGIDPAAMSEELSSLRQPCAERRSIVSTDNDVLFASYEGVCSIAAGAVLTAELFSPEEFKALFPPDTIAATWHEGWYIATYFLGTGRKGFMFHVATKTWVDLPLFTATGFYRDTVTNALYCIVGNQVQKWRGAATVWPMRWRSSAAVTEWTDFTAARLYKGLPDVTFKLFADGVLRDTTVVSSRDPFRLDEGTGQAQGMCRKWEVELAAAEPEAWVTALGLFQSVEEAGAESG